jgi:DNA-binding MarR family transcriptional regulator
VRTQRVLAVVQAHPGLNNHRISQFAGISDQGQISRLMMRLSAQGLLENLGGRGQGAPKAWHLTRDGEAVIQANHPLVDQAEQAPALRLTVRTHKVLAAIAKLSIQGAIPSNREISDAAGVRDQGQISKLLARLEGHELLENTGGATAGIPNAWCLTEKGEAVLSSSSKPTCVAPSAGTSNSTRER